MTVTEVEILTVTQIPVELLDPAEDNPRGDLGDLTDLAASIEQVGIIQPLIVAPNDTRWRIVAGHRRHAAAQKIGLERVPAIIRDDFAGEDTDAKRQVAMVVENVQRKDLTPLERACGFQQLVDLGNTQEEVAQKCGLSQATVSKALGLLQLPPTIAEKVGGPGGIHVDDAAHLLKLKEHPKALASIEKSTRGRRDDVAAEAKRALADIEHDEKVLALKAEAKAKGWKIVKEVRGFGAKTATYQMLAGGSDNHYGHTLDVDLAKHRTEPCHGAYVREFGGAHLVEVCTKPERHKAKGKSDLKATPGKRRERSAAEQRQLDEQKARKAAFTRRDEHLRPLLAKGSGKIASKVAITVVARVLIDEIGSDAHKAACDLLGLKVPAYKDDALMDEAAKSDTDLMRVAVACALAIGHVGAKAQWHGWDGPDIAALYEFLQATGYELDEFEATQLEEANRQKEEEDREDAEADGSEGPKGLSGDVISEEGEQDLTEEQAAAARYIPGHKAPEGEDVGDPDIARCRQCGCTDAVACEGGCEWVDDPLGMNLCSRCAEELGVELPLSELEQEAAQRNEDMAADDEVAAVSATLISIEEVTKGDRTLYDVSCAEHGQVGRTLATSYEYAADRGDCHVRDQHLSNENDAESASAPALAEILVENAGTRSKPWSVTCSEHGIAGTFPDPEGAHERAQAHVDIVHAGNAVIREAQKDLVG